MPPLPLGRTRDPDSSRLARSLLRLKALAGERALTGGAPAEGACPAVEASAPGLLQCDAPPKHVVPASDEAVPEVAEALPTEPPAAATVVETVVESMVRPPDAEFEAWRERWSERADQVAYRLTLIDAQFEELLRKRERETPATLPGPATTHRDPVVAPLLTEL